ncbi:hypothetical protein JW960_28350 [candidate division KSB1 bacterium]|nr:hypothetical protein [candidate division KSB1 bacterium]
MDNFAGYYISNGHISDILIERLGSMLIVNTQLAFDHCGYPVNSAKQNHRSASSPGGMQLRRSATSTIQEIIYNLI